MDPIEELRPGITGSRQLTPLIAKIGPLVLAVLWSSQAGRAEEQRPLSVEAALGQLAFASRMPIDVSQDGQYVAYTLEDPQRRQPAGADRFRYFSRTGASVEVQACDVWITRLQSGESKNLTGGRGTAWGPVWSPDGRTLAFYSDRTGRARLWIWTAATDQSRPVAEIVVHPLFGFEVPQWTPDGKKLLAKILPEGQTLDALAEPSQVAGVTNGEPAKSGVSAIVYRSPSKQGVAGPGSQPTSWMNASLADLALIDVDTGSVSRIARGQRPRGYWISPDGARIAYTTYQGSESERSQQQLYDLRVHRLDDGSTRVVRFGLRLETGITVSWSPDSTRLAVVTGGPKGEGDCLIVSALRSDRGQQTASPHPSFDPRDATGSSRNAPPLWDADGTALYCVGAGDLWKIKAADATVTRITHGGGPPIRYAVALGHGRLWRPGDGNSAIVVTRDDGTKRVGYERVDLQTGRRIRLIEEDKSYGSAVFSTRVIRSGTQILYIAQDAQHPTDVWLAGPDFRDARRVTRINPELDRSTFGQSRLVQRREADGQTLRGALLLPAGARKDRRSPLLVRVYAGEDLSDGLNRFGLSGTGVENLQLFATRGFAVLAVDARVRPGSVSRDLLKAVIPAVDEVIKMGVADPDRIGVMGHSFGGYSTLALISQTTTFRAAVASGGPADWVSTYGRMTLDGNAFGVSYCEEGQPGLGGPPWAFPDRYLENSPVFHLDRIQTPLLLVHGALDTTVWPSQSEEVFVGLRRLGREVTYARYEGEEHWPGQWSHANAADYLNRVVEFFETHLARSAAR